jgi:LPS export ABC transporter protein LptC
MWFRAFTLLTVIALGLSTWFLSSPAHRPQFSTAGNDAKLPGYFLKHAVLTDYDAAGMPGIRIEADRIEQVAHSNEVALFNVKVDYQPPEGEAWTMYGDTAQVEQAANIVHVQGNVRLQGEATGRGGLVPVIRSDSLNYDVSQQIVTTHDDVHVDYGKNILTAHGLWANLKDRTMRLESKVHGIFHP